MPQFQPVGVKKLGEVALREGCQLTDTQALPDYPNSNLQLHQSSPQCSLHIHLPHRPTLF